MNKFRKIGANTYHLSGSKGHCIVRKLDNGQWAAKAYSNGELHRDLGLFDLRRSAMDMGSYYLDYEMK